MKTSRIGTLKEQKKSVPVKTVQYIVFKNVEGHGEY